MGDRQFDERPAVLRAMDPANHGDWSIFDAPSSEPMSDDLTERDLVEEQARAHVGAARKIHVQWDVGHLEKLLADAEARGRRWAIEALRAEATRAVGAAAQNLAGKRARAYYSGLESAADYLESRLTEGQTDG